MGDVDPRDVRRLRTLENRLEKSSEAMKGLQAERRTLRRDLASAQRVAGRVEAAEAGEREARESLAATTADRDQRLRDAETRLRETEATRDDFAKQIDALVEENRRLAEEQTGLAADFSQLRDAAEELSARADAAEREAGAVRDATRRLEAANRTLTNERAALTKRVAAADAQLAEEGKVPILPAGEVVRLIGDLVGGFRAGMPGMDVRDAEVSLRTAFGGAGQERGFLIPTPDSPPELREVTQSVTLRFNRGIDPSAGADTIVGMDPARPRNEG